MTVLDLVRPADGTDRPTSGRASGEQTRRVVPTTRAYEALVRLHATRGPVVLREVGPRRSDPVRLDCLTERDLAISAADRHVGSIDRCAVYADADADDAEHRPVYLVDVVDGPSTEATLAPDAGHHLVLRRLGVVPAPGLA